MSKIKSIYKNDYEISDNTPHHLLKLGFHKNNEPDERYIYNFTVLRHEKMTVLRGKITAYTDTSKIQIDVTDNNYAVYAPFYNAELGNYDVILNKINENILAEFKKLGITRCQSEQREKT